MVDAGEFSVDDVLEHHGEVEVGPGEQRGVPGDVLADVPEDSGGGWLGGAGAEELDAAKPDGGDAVVLVAVGGGVEVQEDAGPGGRASGGRGVRGGVRWGVDGVGEGVVEDLVVARWGGVLRQWRVGDLQVLSAADGGGEGADETVLVGEGCG